MKLSLSTMALAAVLLSQTVGAANTSAATAAAECGNLGVMKVPDVLPEGVAATDVRKCAAHPLETNGKSHSRNVNGLVSRDEEACETGAPYGCTRGYCWKVCGPGGEWCWTAAGGGVGAWRTCNTYKDCGVSSEWSCGVGCPSCGCSC